MRNITHGIKLKGLIVHCNKDFNYFWFGSRSLYVSSVHILSKSILCYEVSTFDHTTHKYTMHLYNDSFSSKSLVRLEVILIRNLARLRIHLSTSDLRRDIHTFSKSIQNSFMFELLFVSFYRVFNFSCILSLFSCLYFCVFCF